MGLLGLFFNKRFLKLVFIIVSFFAFLEFFTLSISFVSGLSWFLQVALASFVLVVFVFFASRFERFRFLYGLAKFLCFIVVPLILVFNFVLPVSIPFPASVPIKLGSLVLPFLAYFAYRRSSLIWRSPSLSTIRRRSGKLSQYILLPKALEEGHIVYGAGIRGFKVIRFIEVRDQHPDSNDQRNFEGHQLLATAAALSERLTMLKKCRIQASYEVYLQNGSLQCFTGLTCQGRNYRKVRTKIDQFSGELARSLRSTDKTTSATSCPVEDNNQAERILMMPLSITFNDLKQVSNDEYNVRILTHTNPNRPIKLRPIQLVGLSTIDRGNTLGLVDEFARATLSHRPHKNFACIIHIKPLSDRDTQRESKRIGNSYKRAMTSIVEGFRNGLLDGKSESITRLLGRENGSSDPRMIIEEAKTRFYCLKEALESGYFEVSLTIIGEPASAESIARAITNKMLQGDPRAKLSLVRSIPAMIQRVIRRDLALPLGRFNGGEIRQLVAHASKSSEYTTGKGVETLTESLCPLITGKITESRSQEAPTK